MSQHERYLGLPSMVGRKKLNFFNSIKLKVLSKISNWQSMMFSRGRKNVLIKAVAQTAFGGDRNKTRGPFIGPSWKVCVKQNAEVVWGSGI